MLRKEKQKLQFVWKRPDSRFFFCIDGFAEKNFGSDRTSEIYDSTSIGMRTDDFVFMDREKIWLEWDTRWKISLGLDLAKNDISLLIWSIRQTRVVGFFTANFMPHFMWWHQDVKTWYIKQEDWSILSGSKAELRIGRGLDRGLSSLPTLPRLSLQNNPKNFEMGSGGGTVGRVVASDTRDPLFESQHRQN